MTAPRVIHFYEKNIVEIKNEYTTFLVNVITPLIYEGIKSMYNYAIKVHKKLSQTGQEVPSVLKIFQTCLKDVPTLNSHLLELEVKRIKESSKCSEWFDDLVKAVIKSNIVLLTFNTSCKQSDIVNQKYHEHVSSSDFIHKCYIESARSIYDNPELFWHEYPALEIKRNQRDTYAIIKESIKEAIRKMLPIRSILTEYLQNDYCYLMDNSQYVNIK